MLDTMKEQAQMTSKWRVYKFGGTSLKDATMFQRVAEILKAERNRPLAVVVSAMAGVTDALMEMGRLAQEGDDRYVERVIETKRRHKEAAEVLLNEKELADFETFLTRQMRDVIYFGQLLWPIIFRKPPRILLAATANFFLHVC